MSWIDDFNGRQDVGAGGNARGVADYYQILAAHRQQELARQLEEQKKKQAPKGNLLTSLIPTGGGIGGALAGGAAGAAAGSVVPVVGTAIGGLLGAILGGAGGSALGKVGENAIEGQADLGQGVGEEALWGGVTSLPLGAGLKLARAGVKAGTGIGAKTAGQLVQEAGAATVPRAFGRVGADVATQVAPVPGKVANFFSKQADSAALRAAKVNGKKDALTKFADAYGQDLGNYLRTSGMAGKGASDIKAGIINPLKQQYGAKVGTVGTTITADHVAAANASKLAELAAGVSTTNQKIAAGVKQELEQIFAAHPNMTAKELNSIKSEYQKLASKRYALGADPTVGNINEEVAGILKKTLQHVSGDDELMNLGMQIDKASKAAKIVGSGAANGQGNLTLGMTDMLSLAAGGVGGVPGALATMAAKRAINSPRTQAMIANAGEKAGAASMRAPRPAGQGLLGLAGRQVAGRALTGGYGGQEQPQDFAGALNGVVDPSMLTDPSMSDPSLQDPYLTDPAAQSAPTNPFGISLEDVAGQMRVAMQNGDSKGYSQLGDLYDRISEYETAQTKSSAGAAPGYSKPSAAQYSQALTALDSVDQIERMLAGSGGSDLVNKNAAPGQDIPVVGGLVSGALGTSQYRALSKNILNSVARINTGANMPASEEAFYKQTYLPQPGDSEATKATKIANLRQFFMPIATYSGGGTDLASVLSGL
jgi:hypothetical protein